VRIARGSLKESETQILLAGRFGYLTSGEEALLLKTSDRLNRLLTGLIKAPEGIARTHSPFSIFHFPFPFSG